MTELHMPVMAAEVRQYLLGRRDGVYVDATLGDGGHALAIASCLDEKGLLVGIDWDSGAMQRAEQRLAEYSARVKLVHASYTSLEEILADLGCPRVDGILLDLGVSTLQLMEPARGFSYLADEPLDMRMNSRLPYTAADLVNSLPIRELRRLIYHYGEERWAGRIASRIEMYRRKVGPVETGRELAELIKEAIPAAARRSGGHPARRTFQALRIAVNRELENIEAVLPQALRSLVPGGRLCVIAYHSLEDRIVKNFIRKNAESCHCPPQAPCSCGGEAALVKITRKAVRPQAAEVEQNPRARSARLRVAARASGHVLKKGAVE
jgi:16S rRNA (cytosine1402-N4)-methyltransferase